MEEGDIEDGRLYAAPVGAATHSSASPFLLDLLQEPLLPFERRMAVDARKDARKVSGSESPLTVLPREPSEDRGRDRKTAVRPSSTTGPATGSANSIVAWNNGRFASAFGRAQRPRPGRRRRPLGQAEGAPSIAACLWTSTRRGRGNPILFAAVGDEGCGLIQTLDAVGFRKTVEGDRRCARPPRGSRRISDGIEIFPAPELCMRAATAERRRR